MVAHAARAAVSTPARSAPLDIRKRMDDIYKELEQKARQGHMHLPSKFVDFHRTDVMYRFVRAAVAYALAFVKATMLQEDHTKLKQQHGHMGDADNEVHDESGHAASQKAMQQQASCATELAETYARLVLHCSNFEHHKEDERFFECVYYYTCSVVKVGLVAAHWERIEEELGFLFRGAQFNVNRKPPTRAKGRNEIGPTTTGTSVNASFIGSINTSSSVAPTSTSAETGSISTNDAAKKMQQSFSATVGGGGGGGGVSTGRDALPHGGYGDTPFLMPKSSRFCHFTESVPVGRIVSELDSATRRATHNMEVAQTIRERIQVQRAGDAHQRRQGALMASPRLGIPLGGKEPSLTARTAGHPSQQTKQRMGMSPRVSMKSAFTTRSPAVSHLIPGTEERVRIALEEYEQELGRKRSEWQVKAQANGTASPTR